MADFWGVADRGSQLMVSVTSTQDVANNRSLVRTILYFSRASGFVADGNMQVGVVINGVQTYWWTGFAQYNTGLTQLADVSQWVNHNSDGTGSVTVNGGVAGGNTGNPTVYVNVNTLTLPPIARATTPTWSGNFVAGVEKTIFLPRASSDFVHDVFYTFGSKYEQIVTWAGVSWPWTPPLELLAEIPNAASAVGVLSVITKHGVTGVTIGVRTAQFTLVAATDVVPAVSSVVWDDANTVVKANIGGFVQGLSRVTGAVTAAGIYGSAITEKRLRVGASIVAEGTQFTVEGSGTVTAQGEAVDSRGRLGILPANFTVLAYEPPRLGTNGWQVRRATGAGVPESEGTYLRLDLHAVAKSLIVGTEKNALTVRVKTRPVGGGWTNRNVITPGLSYDTNVLITGGAVFLATVSYEVEVSLEDNTGTPVTRLVTVIPTSAVALDLNGVLVGVGKYHEQGALDVGPGGIYDNGNRVINVTNTATEAVAGIVERATQAEVNTGTDTTRYVSPATLRNADHKPYAMAAGRAAIGATPYTTVTLPVGRFTQAPRIVVMPATSDSGNVLIPWRYSPADTATSFQVAMLTMSAVWTAGTLDWEAVQMTSTNASG